MQSNHGNPLGVVPMVDDAKTVLEAGVTIGARAHEPIDIKGVPIVLVPKDFKIESLLPHMPADQKPRPTRKTGTVEVRDVDSFVRYVNKHKSAGTEIFAVITGGGATFTAVLNYHGEEADYGDHRCVYTCRNSVEWNRWIVQDRKALEQQAFCEHLEDCAKFILEPKGADLLAVLQSLEGHVNARFAQATNLFNGKVKLNYEEDVEMRGSQAGTTQGEMQIPTELELALPPFEFGNPYRVKARLKIRVAQRKVTFIYETVDTHLVIRDAVNGMLEQISAGTEIKPLLGSV